MRGEKRAIHLWLLTKLLGNVLFSHLLSLNFVEKRFVRIVL